MGVVVERSLVHLYTIGQTLREMAIACRVVLPTLPILISKGQVSRVVITAAGGEQFLGTGIPTNLLSVLNPMEPYRTVETLEQKVSRLEAENLTLRQNHSAELERQRNAELEKQIAARMADLQVQTEREKLLMAIALQIRGSLNLAEVLSTAVTAVRSFLNCDRLLVLRFESDRSGTVVAESVGDSWRVALHDRIDDLCLKEKAAARYIAGQITAVDNVDIVGYSDCYRKLLNRYQVKANLVVPILVAGKLWGLLIGHHCADYYTWQQTDLLLLEDIAVHLAIAIQQATAYEQAQIELTERRRTEAALKKSEATNRAIIQAMPDLLIRLSREGHYLSFASGSEVKALYPVDQTIHSTPYDLLPPALAEQKLRAIEQALVTQSLQVYEQELEIEGKRQHEEVRIVPAGDDEVLVIVRDITERKRSGAERQQSELALRQSEAQLAEAQRVAHIGNWELDVETKTMVWSAELFRILGCDPALGEPSYTESLRLYHPDDAARLEQAVALAIAHGESSQLLLRAVQPDGSWLYVEAIARAKLDRHGQVMQLFGTIQDVTVRVQAEKALQNLVEGTAAVTGDDFFPALVEYLSSALGSSHAVVSELIGDHLYTRAFWFRNQIQPNFKYRAATSPCQVALNQGIYCHPAQVQQGFPNQLELVTLKAEGYLGIALTNTTGQPIGVLCVLYDHPLTDVSRLQSVLQIFAARAAAELERERATHALEQLNQALETKVEERTAALRQSDERWQLVLRGTNDGIFDWDVKRQRVFYSSRWKEMRGFTDTEIGDTLEEWSQRIHPDDYDRTMKAIAAHFEGITEFYELQYRTRCKDNTYMWVVARGQAERDEQGQVSRIGGSETDITPRKQAEADRDRLLSLLEASLNEIYVFDAATLQFEYTNQGAVQNLGYSVDELKRMTLLDLNPNFTEADLRQRLQPLLDQQQDKLVLETRQHRADGSSYPIEIHLQQHQYRDEHDQDKQVFLAVILDMTERQRSEQELRGLSTRLELALKSAQIGIWEWDIMRDRLIFDERMYELYGVNPEDFTGTYDVWETSLHPDDLPVSRDALQQALRGENPFAPEFRVVLPDESIRVLKANSITQHNAQGEPQFMIGITYDITDIKRTEETLRQQKETLQTIFDHIPLMLGLFSPIGEVRIINREMERVIGWTQAEYGDVDVLEACYPDPDTQVKFIQHMFAANSTWQDFQTRVRNDQVLTTTWSHIRLSDGSTIGIGQDITARKQAEMALQESQRFVQQIAEASPNILYLYDLQEQRNIYINREIGTILGYTSDEIRQIGAALFQTLMHPDDLDRLVVKQDWFSSAQDGDILETEYRMRHANGEWRWLNSRDAVFSRDAQGRVKQTISAAQDISERKRSEAERKLAEAALRLSEERFRRYFEQSLVGMAITSADKGWVEVNDRLCEILGYSREELTHLTWLEMTHHADLDADVACFNQVIAGEIEGYSIDKRFICKDGRLIDASISAQSIRQANGVLDCLIMLVQDITDRKRLEEEQNRLLAILQASTDYIAMLDAEGKIFWKNAELERLWGVLENKDFWQLHVSDGHPQWATQLILQEGFPSARANGSWVGETALLDAEQQEIPVSQLILAHKSPQGEVEYFSAIMRDMRARKEYEQQLERSNADLARATRLKDEFLANMSHELRTPLNAILGMSEGLQEAAFGLLNDRQNKAIATIERSGRHLLELINDILDLSKIEAGKLTLDLNQVSVHSICQSSIAFVKQMAFKKQISLNTQIPDFLSNVSIWADDRRIRQVLINLLNNAVKFTPEGGSITLEVRLETEAPRECLSLPLEGRSNKVNRETPTPQTLFPLSPDSESSGSDSSKPDSSASGLPPQSIIFSVVDTGIGIAPENLSQLFHAFVQIDSSLSRQYAGTGLGLALVKRIVELHGGIVTVESELNRGSCFMVRLPLVYGFAGGSAVPDICLNRILMPVNNHRAMVIDDAPVAADLVVRYLHDLGMQATIYPYGEGAFAEVLRLQPALVILDLQLPNVSGWDVLLQLKQHPNTKAIPVIVASVVDDLQRGLSLGASAYLVKPFTRGEFQAALEKLRSPLSDLADHTASPLILLAEDNAANVETMTGYLEGRGYRLIVAATGQQAIDLAQAHSPDIILMDIQMPGMDGLEATRQIREISELAQTPIVALTALAMPGDREKCLAAGATEYLTKPIRLRELVAMIQSLLQPPDSPE